VVGTIAGMVVDIVAGMVIGIAVARIAPARMVALADSDSRT
jgi:hypothetical protein